jgi:hypothetical protein
LQQSSITSLITAAVRSSISLSPQANSLISFARAPRGNATFYSLGAAIGSRSA